MSVRDDALALLRVAESDQEAAEYLRHAPDSTQRVVLMLCQATVEKALKALLRQRQIEQPFTHSIDWLAELISTHWGRLPQYVDQMGFLTRFATFARYDLSADDVALIATLDVPQVVRQTRSILETAKAWCAE